MKSLKVCATLILAMSMTAASISAGRLERASETVEPDGYEALEVELEFAAGVIEITAADMDEPAKLDVEYTARYVDYSFDYSKRGKTCRLFMESDLRSHRWDDDDIDNEWTLVLSKKYATSLDMDIGACEARLDLSGIPLVDLTVDVGAADMEIEFSEPNPERLRELNVDCGASSLEIFGLANANAEIMDFDIGAGSCKIDLRGEITGDVEIDIDVGVGSMDVIVSRGVELMVRGDDDWFSSLDFHGLDLDETRRGVWETDGFDEADNRIVFNVDVAMGSVDIYAKR